MIEVLRATSESQFRHVAELLREYARWLGIATCGGRIEAELTPLPGVYGPPGGVLLVALEDGQVAGCVALRELEAGICEMKRLYVRPPFRGHGVGRKLVQELMDRARALGYRKMRLDTIDDRMAVAVALYRSVGFTEVSAYGRHVSECTTFLELTL